MTEKRDKNQNKLPTDIYLLYESEIIPITNKVFRLGRGVDNHIVFQRETVSRNHAEIRYQDGLFSIIDLESTGGTFVNNQKIDAQELKSGDILLLADVPMMFIIDDGSLLSKSEKRTDGL
jgi:pSer/pThr/pTyr-binding forkhead associated (FHA) protein